MLSSLVYGVPHSGHTLCSRSVTALLVSVVGGLLLLHAAGGLLFVGKLGEGGRRAPPHEGEGSSSPEPAGAGRSCRATPGDYSGASAGCYFVVRSVRVLRAVWH